MELLDPYVSVDEYRTRAGSLAIADDPTLAAQLVAVSRLIEEVLKVAPGAFNSVEGTRYFDSDGTATLRLRDAQGKQHFLQSVDANAIGVDNSSSGAFTDYALDFDDDWVVGVGGLGQPYEAITISPITSAAPYYWPRGVRTVSITGVWGWPSVPGVIKELVVGLARDMRQGQLTGSGGSIADFEGFNGRALSPGTYFWWTEAKRLLSRELTAFA
ncbi:MAG TPA: hypothetical protein VEA63_07000 [Opitutus sp.]|nr:hypothetical protein [Opitutus sp.]